ncbi:hypothetical protein D3C71_1494890 [compost metagenome]
MAAAAEALVHFLPGLDIAGRKGRRAEQACGERQAEGQGGDFLHVAFPDCEYSLLEHDSRGYPKRSGGHRPLLANSVCQSTLMLNVSPHSRAGSLPQGVCVLSYFLVREVLSSMAALINDANAFSSICSPSWTSMARRVLPSRLALNSFDGSSSEAPLAKVSFTTCL